MKIVILIGVLTTLAGLAGLVVCILRARKIKSDDLDAETARARLRGLIALNMGSVAVAVFGLILVVFGIILD